MNETLPKEYLNFNGKCYEMNLHFRKQPIEAATAITTISKMLHHGKLETVVLASVSILEHLSARRWFVKSSALYLQN